MREQSDSENGNGGAYTPPSKVEAVALSMSIGGGVAAAKIMQAGALATMGTAAVGVGSALAGGLASAGIARWHLGQAINEIPGVKESIQTFLESIFPITQPKESDTGRAPNPKLEARYDEWNNADPMSDAINGIDGPVIILDSSVENGDFR